MSAFTRCFLFLRNPAGGVENLSEMKAAGFAGVFCNVVDYPVAEWEKVIVPRARALDDFFCGPWGRTGHSPPQGVGFEEAKLDKIIATADRWSSPLVVNAETEIDFSGDACTSLIAQKVGARDAAVSTLQMPFAAVDWTPVAHLPLLPQVFPAETGRGETSEQTRQAWWDYGVRCVYMTFGTYAGKHGRPQPDWYELQAPYSLYTADDIEGGPTAYPRWSPTSSGYVACNEEEPMPEPTPDVVPAGAYDDVARLQTDNIKRPDGKDATAFNDQAKSLKAARTAVNDHERRLAAIEKKLGL